MKQRPCAILFDLDGTLIDSAPDLAHAANSLRASHGLTALDLDQLRPMVGSGARGMIGVAFGLRPGDVGYEALRKDFLQRYIACMLQRTRVFDTVKPVLDVLDKSGLPWGIVTNKAMSMAQPIVRSLGLLARAAVVIGGDSTAHTKPHPMPLLEAARLMDIEASRCIYVGDDARDMQAAQAAGMPGLAAGWGYLGQGEPIHAWGAEVVLERPESLLNWLQLA